MKEDKKIITAQIDSDIYDKLVEMADNDYTTISCVVRKIISNHFKE